MWRQTNYCFSAYVTAPLVSIARLLALERHSISVVASVSVMSGPRWEIKKLRSDFRVLGRFAEIRPMA